MAQTPPIFEPRGKTDQSAKPQTPAWLYKRIGRYQLQALLGEGSNGRVFRAEDLQLGRQVALKVFSLTGGTKDPVLTFEQAVREAKLAAGLEHPHIVHIYEVNETTKICYIAMELVEGGNLKQLIRGSGPMEYRRACQIIAEIGEALGFAHERGVIHRDVKPANLMLSGGGRCKLADFGLAILNSRFSDGVSRGVAGTPQFMAPELINGEPASQRSDIYSLGATLWFLLTGAPPFAGDSVPELLDKHLHEPLANLTQVLPDSPPSLGRAIARAMEKNPAARYDSAEQFASVLRVHTIPVGGTASSWANLGVFPAPVEPVPVRRALLWGGLAATVVVGAMAPIVYWLAGAWSKPPGHMPLQVPSARVPAERAVVAAASIKATHAQASTSPAPLILATDTATLTRLATDSDPDHPIEVAVEGTVTTNQASKHAKYFRLSFSNSEESKDFVCTYKPELLPALQAKFGGIDGLNLAGKHIHVAGHIELFKDRPAIRIDAVDQINLVR